MSEVSQAFDKVLEAQNRTLGRLEVIKGVLTWLVDHQARLPKPEADSLRETLDGFINASAP